MRAFGKSGTIIFNDKTLIGDDMDLYTSIVFVTIAFLAVVVWDTFTNRIVSDKIKRGNILVCCLVAVATICEWAGVKTNGADASLIFLHKLAKVAEFSIFPFIAVMAAFTYGKAKYPKIAIGALIAHAVFELVAMHFGLVISVDSENIYTRGSLYFIYVIFFSASIVYCFASIISEEVSQHNRIDHVLLAALMFVIIGIGVQMIFPDIRIDYLCTAICSHFLYYHRNKMILQMDGLTRLLNRRCFEKDVERLKAPAVIVSMDVNDFKTLNDTYGHGAGDICLKEIGGVIREVFGRYGYCYRYGWDEFCVILKRRLNDTELLCKEFEKAVEESKSTVAHLPDVAVGYARFDKNDDVKDVLVKADEMMYKVKNRMKNRE